MQDEVRDTGPQPGAAGGPPRAAAPEPVVARAAGTGDPRVDELIARLDGLAGQPLADQVAVFEEAHTRLRQVLGELDTGAGAATPGGR